MLAVLSKERNQEKEEFFKFLERKCETTDAPLNLNQMAKEFIVMRGSGTEPKLLGAMVQDFKKTVWRTPDRNTMVRQLFGLNLPCNYRRRQKLMQHAEIEFRNRRIIKYISNDGTLQLENTVILQLAESKQHFFDFLAEKCRTTKSPLYKTKLVPNYMTDNDSPCAGKLSEWLNEYKKGLGRMDGISHETRIKNMFVLGSPIDNQLFLQLKQDAYVERNKRYAIKTYISHDGKLRFQDFHCFADGEEEEDEAEEDILHDDPVDPTPPAPKKPRISSGTADPTAQQQPTSSSSVQAASEKRKARKVTAPLPARLVKAKSDVDSDSEVEDINPDARNSPNLQVNQIEDENPEIQEDMEPEVHQEQPLTPKVVSVQPKVPEVVAAQSLAPEVQPIVPEVPHPRMLTLENHKDLLEIFAHFIAASPLPMDVANLEDISERIGGYQNSGNVELPEPPKVQLDNLLMALGDAVTKVDQYAGYAAPGRKYCDMGTYFFLLFGALNWAKMKEFNQLTEQLKPLMAKYGPINMTIPTSKAVEYFQAIENALIPN